MELQNSKLHRSDIGINMPPRWGFSSFGHGGYNDVAPPELKNGSSAAAPRTAFIVLLGGDGKGEGGPILIN